LDEKENKLSILNLELEKEKIGLEKEINSRTGHLNTPLYEVVISFQATAPTECEFQVSYITFGTGWEAFYDVRVISQEKEAEKLELTYYGNILNSSGEDWVDAALTLSTATPSVAGKPPPLNAKWVQLRVGGGYYNYSDAKENVGIEKKVKKIAHKEIRENRSKNTNTLAPVVAATASASANSTSFSIQRKTTILSDGKSHKVTIKTLDKLDATFLYSITPAVSGYAYLKAIIKNTADFPLLAGELNVFMDSSFVAKSAIDLINPYESFALYLGIDPSIKVDYRPTRKSNAASGFISKSITEDIKDITVITNNKSKLIDVVILQQLPKSTDSNLKVRIVEPEIEHDDPIDDDPDDKTPVIVTTNNHVRWRLPLTAGEKKEIEFSYTIERPADREYY